MGKIRVAYAGHDFFFSCLHELMKHEDVDLVWCLTEGPGGHPASNVRELAVKAGARVHTGRPTPEMLASFNNSGIDLLVCAAYMHKIPVSRMVLKWAVNVHPALLPQGKGPNPLPYLVSQYRTVSGVSIHQMTEELDSGPLLLQAPISLSDDDGLDELYLKILATAAKLLREFLADIEGHYARKVESGEGSYWPEKTDQDRTVLTAKATTSEVRTMHRNFGMFGFLLQLADGTLREARYVKVSTCEHEYPPGSIVAELSSGTIVAIRDGLLRFS
jgi:methionyl-tRNA formyltransferase